MKIYILHPSFDYGIHSVWSSIEKAETALKKVLDDDAASWRDYYIEEVEVDFYPQAR